MQTRSDSDSLVAPRIIVRKHDTEHGFDEAVVIAANGTAQDVAKAMDDPGCHLFWSKGTLRVNSIGGAAIRVNSIECESEPTLSLHDVVRCGEVDVVIDRLEAGLARASVYALAGNATLPPAGTAVPRSLTTPADALIEPDESLQLDAEPAIVAVASRRTSRWQLAASVAGVLLVAAFIGLLLVQRVALKLSPADAQVRVSGAVLAWHSGETLFLFPGEYRLIAARQGYRSAEATVNVARGIESRAAMQLEKLPGLVAIDTAGVEANVSVDGKPMGKVPAEIEIAAGDRTLTLRANRYLDQIVRVNVLGLGKKQSVKVTMQPSFGVVQVVSSPAGAQISVDGKLLGSTPAKLELSAGVRRVALQAPGLRPWESSIVIQAGEETTLGPIELGAADARLTLRSMPSAADVLVAGALRGKTPVTLALSPGVDHELTIARAGYDSQQRRVFAAAGKTSELTVKLVPRLVAVRVEGKPSDAEVLVDGQLRGTAPLDLRLPATRQRIEVRKTGFESYSAELVLAPGLDRTLQYDLVNPRDIVGNAAAKIETKHGITFQLVAGGVFQMGSARREQGRRPNEGSRRVTLQRPFYLGDSEITNGQFRQFRSTHNSGSVDNQSLDIDLQAVTNVSWNDAVEFCNWLSSQEGLPAAYQRQGASWVLKSPVENGYRLPTEAEWEFAARYAGAGKFLRYSWGESLPVPAQAANLAGAEARDIAGTVLTDYRDDFGAIAKPRQFPANKLGLYDMTGNVSEWTSDHYSSYFDSSAATDTLGPAEGQQRVIRGANWRTHSVSELRLAWRDGASEPSDTIGFRVARYVAP